MGYGIFGNLEMKACSKNMLHLIKEFDKST
jgi:hypothetical protein